MPKDTKHTTDNRVKSFSHRGADKQGTANDNGNKIPKEKTNKFREQWIEREKFNELEHKYKRALADYQNLLKQTARERQEFVKFASEQTLSDILPVYDNLKLALKHAKRTTDDAGIKDGIKYVLKQFEDILKNAGLEEIKTIGEKFDHHTMEAVDGRGERVKREIKPGYKLHGKVITPAKVILS